MKLSRGVVVVTVLTVLGAACSSGGRGAVPTATTRAPATSLPTTTSAPPPVVAISASLEPWTLPAAVSRPVVLPDERDFVILGGLATGDTSTSRIVTVDPGGGVSRLSGYLAVAVHDSAGAVIGGRFFVFGGGSTNTVSVVQAWTAGSAAQVAGLPEDRGLIYRRPRSLARPTSPEDSMDRR